MDPELKICIFSLSKRDIFQDEIEFAVNWLAEKGEDPYYFRERKPKNGLPPGSIVLFSFLAQIFGRATVKEDVQKVPSEIQRELKKKHGFLYRHYMILDASSIDIFPRYPKKKDISRKLGIRFAQLFTYINWQQYQEILKMARRR